MSPEYESDVKLLEKNIYVLQIVCLWPNENEGTIKKVFKNFIMISITAFFSFGVFFETIRELGGMRDDVNSLLTSLLSIGIITATVSLVICYRMKQKYIFQIIDKLRMLESYFKPTDLVVTENRMNIFTTILFYYTNVADVLYVFLPFIQYGKCLESQKTAVHLQHVPCGMWTPLWYPFDYTYSPMYELIIFMTLCFTYVFSINSIAICALNISVTVHMVGHLRNLKKQFKIALEQEKSLETLKRCIEYHIEIIKYIERSRIAENYYTDIFLRFSDYANKCFSIFNLVINVISTYMIGILEYQMILETSNVFESFRYGFHFIGWIMVLFMLNFAAQLLWDESLSVGDELYSIKWEDCPTFIQKDILFILERCIIPLTSNTGAFGVMRNETFLWILQTAYTFYAIFSNVKNQ